MSFLKNKTAIVTGAAQGLGKAFAQALATSGANVTVFDLQSEVSDTARDLARHGHGVLARVGDVSRRADCEKVVADTVAEFGGVDILVNNAAKWKPTPVVQSWDDALTEFDEIMDTNLKGVLIMSRLCVPRMIERGGGDIVNISTYYVLPARSDGTNPPNTDIYNASKWALNGLTDGGAQGLAQHNIRVNALAMGAVDTPLFRQFYAPDEPPADLLATFMKPAQMGQLLIDLLKDGRSGENIGAWLGYPIELGPRKRWDVKMRERADFTGRPALHYGPPPWLDAPEPVEHLVVGKPQ